VGSVSNGACSGGSYLRIGIIVLVDLTGCSLTVTGPPGNSGVISTYGPPFDIRVAALFVPDVSRGSNGVTTLIQDAILAGVWTGASTT
jgi:hypothetical protein